MKTLKDKIAERKIESKEKYVQEIIDCIIQRLCNECTDTTDYYLNIGYRHIAKLVVKYFNENGLYADYDTDFEDGGYYIKVSVNKLKTSLITNFFNNLFAH